MDNKTCELVQTLMNANEKLEKEVKFLRNRKSELDMELKRYIECNESLHNDKKNLKHDASLLLNQLNDAHDTIALLNSDNFDKSQKIKNYIECNDNLHRKIEQHDKKLNEKYWEGVARGQQQAIEEQRDNNFDKQAEYLKGYKEGTAAVFEIWNRVRAK